MINQKASGEKEILLNMENILNIEAMEEARGENFPLRDVSPRQLDS